MIRSFAPGAYVHDANATPDSPPMDADAERFQFPSGTTEAVDEKSLWEEHEYVLYGGEYNKLIKRVFLQTDFETPDIGVADPHKLKIEIYNFDTATWAHLITRPLPRYAKGFVTESHYLQFDYTQGEIPSEDPHVNAMNVLKFRVKMLDNADAVVDGDADGPGYSIDNHGSGYQGMAFIYEYYPPF